MPGLRRLAHRIPGAVGVVRAARRGLRPQTAPLDWQGGRLRVHVASDAVVRSRLHPVAKEPWTAAWIEQSVGTGDVFWDIGANIGGYSLIAAAAGAGRVIAVEPSPASYSALCDNLVLNELDASITPLPVLLARKSGIETLGLSDPAAGAASHGVGSDAPPSDAVSVVARIAVASARLDDLVGWLGLPPPTLVKLDVDGGEADVLAGGPTTFSRPELRSVLIEIERRREDDVLALVERYGLVLRERVDERDGLRLAHVWYGIFERPTGT
jgi:FkbM family methyltransferase